MSEKDVVENVDSLGEISIPIATNSEPGIASFDSNDFTVGADGKVNSIVGRGIPQYLGKITGTGTGTTDLNWEVDWKSRPTIDAGTANEEVDKAKRIKIGEYIMLTEHFNQFVPGDIFRITNVQIEGSAYTVKTNNVRALSLASIIGPQGKQGEQGEQGVSYLAYTNNIVDTVDPVISTPMYLTDGAFNRTPAKSDAVTVDWYNSTTHRAFMVTGIISDRASAGRWVALITAITDITGAVGPQGKEGAGIGDIVDIDYPHGEFTSVQYDTDDGIKLQGIAQYLRDDGETYQIPTDIDIPLKAGNGINIDVSEDGKHVEVKNDLNIENGMGDSSVQQKYIESNVDYSAQATGKNATAFGGKRYDKLSDTDRTATSAEGNQSFAAGGSTHAIGDFATALGKDGVAYQKGSFVAAMKGQAGLSEEEFNARYWDSSKNIALHGGKGKDSNGNILNEFGEPYSESYSTAAAFGDGNKARGYGDFAVGNGNTSDGSGNFTTGNGNTVDAVKSFTGGEANNVAGDVGNAITYGQHLKNTGRWNKATFGQWNAENKNNVLEVGGGESEATRKNIFEVDYNGNVHGTGIATFDKGAEFTSYASVNGLIWAKHYIRSNTAYNYIQLSSVEQAAYLEWGRTDSNKNTRLICGDNAGGASGSNTTIIYLPNKAGTIAFQEYVDAKVAEKVSITVPQGATNGTLTDEQLATLQASEANYIEMVNDKELYYLNDNGHVDGYLTYSHIGIENSKATIKTLTITVSAKSFVVVTTVMPTDAGGGKLYRHGIRFQLGSTSVFFMEIYNTSNVELKTFDLVIKNVSGTNTGYYTGSEGFGAIGASFNTNGANFTGAIAKYDGSEVKIIYETIKPSFTGITDTVTEV